MKPPPHIDYECPYCDEWIEILESTPPDFFCPWCEEPLSVDGDGLHKRTIPAWDLTGIQEAPF